MCETVFSGLTGLEQVAAWLQARLFITNYRPIPLTEHVVMQGVVYAKVRDWVKSR